MPTKADKKWGVKDLTPEERNIKVSTTRGEQDELITDHYILNCLRRFEYIYKEYLLGKLEIDGGRGFEEAMEIAKNVSYVLSEEFANNYKQEIINNLNKNK